jgi:hypothetical protein
LTSRTPVAIALILMLAAIWLLTHRYAGLAQDARIYAFQALSRIDSTLRTDLYLQNTSQDRYTFFSPFYALVIRVAGLPNAARALSILCAAAFLTASGKFARDLLGNDAAWLSVGALILTVGAYGSSRVFHFAEDYLTARSAAEALIAIALAVYFGGARRMALLVAAGALLIHPLMALPGALLLILLMVPMRGAAMLAIAGTVLAACVAVAASTSPWCRNILPTMDRLWLDIVMERSQFLFLQLWSLRDWEVNLRPFASLALAALILPGGKIRPLCAAAALVGASGLLVAMVAGTVGPVALLVQGQAWRWVWIPVFVATILMPPTAIRLWQDEAPGPLCAVLLVAGWTLSRNDAPSLALLSLGLFLLRHRFMPLPPKYLRMSALAVGIALLCWEWVPLVMPATGNGGSPGNAGATTPLLQSTAILAACRYPLGFLLLLTWQWLRASRDPWRPASSCIALAVVCVLLVPVAFARTDTAGSAHDIAEFTDWRTAIPPSANVYVANGHDAAPFAWFTLQRPNYLSLDQSAGVVFSRATALEVRRRSEVLMPLMDEDWKLLSRNRDPHRDGRRAAPRLTPLTAKSLLGMCSDPKLNFLIAREDVGFDPIRHRHPGPWMNWNLYDCGHVRGLRPSG